jgi:hypothetical protein
MINLMTLRLRNLSVTNRWYILFAFAYCNEDES